MLASSALSLAGCGLGGGSASGGAGAVGAGPGGDPSKPAAPVEVGAAERGTITLRRTFSGTIEASSRVQIASRVPGHLERLAVDIGDRVQRDQVIAWIEDDELEQDVLQSEADLAVARASKVEAEASAEFARRALERLQALDQDGVASKSELDSVRTSSLAREAAVAVAAAREQRADAALASARLRRGQAEVAASWEAVRDVAVSDSLGPPASAALEALRDDARVVSARYVDEGTVIAAGTPIVDVVDLTPVIAVVFVPERDYGRLSVGQAGRLRTDAYSGETFTGVVARVAPIFSRDTRQVRVEIEVANEDLRLKPGMFVRATLELAEETNVQIVPFAALTERGAQLGVFRLVGGDATTATVRWTPVEAGIREDDRVSVTPMEEGVELGRCVTLGHELCDDGSTVVVPAAIRAAPTPR